MPEESKTSAFSSRSNAARSYVRDGRWDRLAPATAISIPILFLLWVDAGILDLLFPW